MFNELFLRRRLTCFYVLFYVLSFVSVMNTEYFLHNPYQLVFFNAMPWVPQIIHTYVNRSRRGPSMRLVIVMQLLQSFLPVYLSISSQNFMNRKPQPMVVFYMILVFSI